MKITFLGTGHGVPSAERSCSSIMLEVGDAIYYVDGGAAIAERTMLAGRELTDAKALFLTHAHSDHVAGIFQFADLFNWKYKESEFDFYLTEKSVNDAMISLIAATTKPIDENRIRFHVMSPDFKYSDENIKVSLYPTKHLASLGRPSYGILIEAEGKKVYFSGDLSQFLAADDFPTEIISEAINLFVCEFAHFRIAHLEPYLSKINARAVAFTHVYPLTSYDDIEAMRGKYSFKVYAPDDMSVIEL